MKIILFYKNILKNNQKFHQFLDSFLEKILPSNINFLDYKQSFIEYLFFNNNNFLYQLKYNVFMDVDSEYLKKLFHIFLLENDKWIRFIWDCCDDKESIMEILTILSNKKIEILQTIILPSFKSFESDIKNSEMVTNMLNAILDNMQKLHKEQNIMFANVSHEMRTPLNAVIGYLDILDSMNTLTLDERKYINYAKNSSKILLTLINDLLDTQKLHSASIDITNNPFWLNKILKTAVLIASINAHQKHIDFIYDDTTHLLNEVIGDKNRFLQILNNIFSNAIKFTPEYGKVVVTVRSKETKKDVKLFITVKDNGIGIPKNKQHEIFKPFKRATNKEKGTGLGLFISKQLINKMGGNIWFESVENKGTTFFIEVLFKKHEIYYSEDLLNDRNIVLFRNQEEENIYCTNLKKQLESVGAKVTIFTKLDKFLQFLMHKDNIDIVIVVYPNKIENNNMDISFINTYKELYKNQKTYFIAGTEDNSYPKNHYIYDRVISLPITIIDILELIAEKTSSIETYKYLIIDDEPMNRMVLDTLIKTIDKNAKVEIAVDGVEGIEKLKQNRYDIVFLDKRMPNKNGYEVLEELNELGIKANIYLLTADGDKETIAKSKEFNVGYIAKPVGLNTIKSVISNLNSTL